MEYVEASFFVHLVTALSLSLSGGGEVHLIAEGFADSPAFV